jgi:RNA polymerase sigma-70 factor (ECF subfamily)
VASPNDLLAGTPDEDLLTRLRAGERDVLGLLIRRYERELYGYLRRYLGDDDLAADVFQTTFVAVYTKIAQYEPGRPGRPWLYAIATNQAIDALRRKARRAERTVDPVAPAGGDGADDGRPLFDLLAAKDADPADLAETAETRRRVREAVDALPDLLRQVVVLAYFQGLKYQEVADALDIPVGTVKSRLHAAVAKLAAAWDRVESVNEPE